MTADSAKTAVTMSAVVVGGVYAYRKLATPNAKASPTSHFVLGFMVVYVGLAMVAEVAPDVGGMFAWLIAVGDLLVNGTQITKDINTGLKTTAAATGTPTTTTA